MKPITIKEVAKRTGVSQYAIKRSVVDLLSCLPVRDRVAVMEHMFYCKKIRNRRDESENKAIFKKACAAV
jgi:hypothetical protein